jgi:hypothetical protein
VGSPEFKKQSLKKVKIKKAGHRWLIPVILVAQEDHGSNPAGTSSLRDPILKNPLQK